MLTVEIVQAVLLAAILAVLLYRKSFQPSQPPQAPLSAHDRQDVQLLQRGSSGEWVRHSSRPVGHRDIQEALATPGLAISRNGRIEEGVQ